jgi:hypothetical protein
MASISNGNSFSMHEGHNIQTWYKSHISKRHTCKLDTASSAAFARSSGCFWIAWREKMIRNKTLHGKGKWQTQNWTRTKILHYSIQAGAQSLDPLFPTSTRRHNNVRVNICKNHILLWSILGHSCKEKMVFNFLWAHLC